MADDHSNDVPDDDIEKNQPGWGAELGDGLLLALASTIASMRGAGIGITVHVPGGIVSGMMIPGADWLESLAESAAPSDGNAMMTGLHNSFKDLAVVMREREEASDDKPPTYIHLREAVLVLSGSAPVSVGLWRGRLSAVAGWTLGMAKAS